MNTTVVNSWNELQDALFEGSWNSMLERHRSPYVFRGMSDANLDLRTSLILLGGPYPQLERHLLRNFRKYAHREYVDEDSVWHWLSVAQHYGLPTRLLDWTYSPFVSLHFATSVLDHMKRDGAVWRVNYQRAAELLPGELSKVVRREASNVFTIEMLTNTFGSLEDLDSFADEDFLIFFEPPSVDVRIVNQFALFSMISNPCRAIDDLLREHSELYSKIIIPHHLKWEVRDKLDQVNITERVLFPGLDGVAAWLKRHYSPKAPPITDHVEPL